MANIAEFNLYCTSKNYCRYQTNVWLVISPRLVFLGNVHTLKVHEYIKYNITLL